MLKEEDSSEERDERIHWLRKMGPNLLALLWQAFYFQIRECWSREERISVGKMVGSSREKRRRVIKLVLTGEERRVIKFVLMMVMF